MTDDQFVAAFEGCTIRNEEFHHQDHVRMGFLYMSRSQGWKESAGSLKGWKGWPQPAASLASITKPSPGRSCC
jgi:hypothetical protein